MTTSPLKKFLVLYLAPVDVLASWAKTDPEVKKAAEEKIRDEWRRWMAEHAKKITVTEVAGKTKEVTSAAGIGDTRNDIMLYSIVEAESHELAAQAFAHHPHLQIPQSSVQVMEVHAIGWK